MAANPRDVFARMPGPGVVTFGFDVLDSLPAELRPRLAHLLADPNG